MLWITRKVKAVWRRIRAELVQRCHRPAVRVASAAGRPGAVRSPGLTPARSEGCAPKLVRGSFHGGIRSFIELSRIRGDGSCCGCAVRFGFLGMKRKESKMKLMAQVTEADRLIDEGASFCGDSSMVSFTAWVRRSSWVHTVRGGAYHVLFHVDIMYCLQFRPPCACVCV